MMRDPFVGRGYGENCVASGWHRFAADHKSLRGDERGRFVRAGAPDLSERYEGSIDLAALHARAGIFRRDGLASAKITCSGSSWTRSFLTRG